MTYRMAIAVTSLVNALVAAYLHLWKLGLAGTLACTSGARGCEFVQGSAYGWFFGVDVALIGAVGWTLVFLVALAGTSPAREDDPRLTKLLGALIGFGLVFTLRLKYGEFVVLRAFCVWCAVNAVIVVVNSVLVTLDARRLDRRRAAAAGGGAAPAGLAADA
jgi:uncharacterized membrane protein